MPKTRHQVMLSSTFRDLAEHRQIVLQEMQSADLEPINMEDRAQAPSTNTLNSSLRMVEDSDGYIGIISHRYGSITEDDTLNPEGYSLTEIEYRRALERGIPMSMFVMSGEHPVKPRDVETDPDKMAKLKQWKKHVSERFTYSSFNSLEGLKERIRKDVAELKLTLDSTIIDQSVTTPKTELSSAENDNSMSPPIAPMLWELPPYVGGRQFVGRTRELIKLDEWARAEDNPILLCEAIGGMGKSMLTWHWVKAKPVPERGFEGAIWYSFYERGGAMEDFARHALAYVSQKSVDEFMKLKLVSLIDELVPKLKARPYLLVLDGLERILVAYNRVNAAYLRDEEVEVVEVVDGAGDSDRKRDVRDCIREEDVELLRLLTQAAPSKILITSRMLPKALLNSSAQLLPGVVPVRLEGLDPADAEAILASVGIKGSSPLIRDYLQRHFACHPLVIGVVAGLVFDYPKDPLNFDAWAEDPAHGAGPHLAEWDLVKKRTHILTLAFMALSSSQRALIGNLGLISQACDLDTLFAISPHDKSIIGASEILDALMSDVKDFEERGLIQWNRHRNTFDLHPVIRGYALDSLSESQRNESGEIVANYFEQRSDPPYEEATSLKDLENGLQVVRALIEAKQYERAYRTFALDSNLCSVLERTLLLPREALAILNSFFSNGWESDPKFKNLNLQVNLLKKTSLSFAWFRSYSRNRQRAIKLIGLGISKEDLRIVKTGLSIYTQSWYKVSLARATRSNRLEGLIDKHTKNPNPFHSVSWKFGLLFSRGAFTEAEVAWNLLSNTESSLLKTIANPGEIEYLRGWMYLDKNELNHAERYLKEACQLAEVAKFNSGLYKYSKRIADVYFANRQFAKAVVSLEIAIRFGREGGLDTNGLTARLALAKAKLGDHNAAQIYLSMDTDSQHLNLLLAELYLEIENHQSSRMHALAAYKEAWADGPPYSFHRKLKRAKNILFVLGEPEPVLPGFDPNKIEPIPDEQGILNLIEKLETESQL